jgi:small-conductance mechanosensitive channel
VCAALLVSAVLRGDSTPTPPVLPDAQQVIDFLNQSIAWQRGIVSLGQIAHDPAEVLYFDESRQTGKQALQLSFQFADAYAQYLAQSKPAETQAPVDSERGQPLAQMAAAADQEARERQQQLQALTRKLSTLHGKARQQLQSQIDALQSEVELEQVRAQTMRTILQFSGSASDGGLPAQINALRESVPGLASNTTPPAPTANSAASATAEHAPATGIVAISEDLIQLGRQANLLTAARKSTGDLSLTAKKIRAPLIASLTAIVAQGDQAVEQPETGEADYTQRRQQLDSLTKEFKQLSDAALPLGEQSILLNAYRANLDRWRELVDGEYQADLRTLAVRLGILALVLFAVLTFAEVWRKAIVRYVHDLRRRYQLLLIRRVILWVTIAIATAFALASQIGSLATYIGLVTAGVAVALQNVILAIAGYFFLIGKYGVRVGDRVQIAGVSGVVVDIGLIRLHLMEVGSPETGREPTGRVVVFSNSIVFQSGASFFKQIPGTSYTWHQVALTLAADSNYQAAEKRLLAAVEGVYEHYREDIERQHRALQENLSIAVAVPRPYSRLHLTNAGMEVVIRFPTEMENSSQVDDAVTRAILHAIEESPRMRLVGSATPTIQTVVDKPPVEPVKKIA